MTTQEKLQMERANCETCLLAQAMKDCKACKFNHALKVSTVSTEHEEYIKKLLDGVQ